MFILFHLFLCSHTVHKLYGTMIDLRLRAWMSISVQPLTQCCLQESDRLFAVIGGETE